MSLVNTTQGKNKTSRVRMKDIAEELGISVNA